MNPSWVSTADPATPPIIPLRTGRTAVVCRWLFRRLAMGALVGFLVAFATAVVRDYGILTLLLKKRVLAQGGWLLNFDLSIRWVRVWGFGMLLGLCLPNVRLPEWLKRVLLGGLIGMPVALFGLWFMDTVLAAAAVDRTYAPFANVKLDVAYARPEPHSKLYPSVFGSWFVSTLFAGCGYGLIAGTAWASTGIKRKVLAVIAAMAVMGVTLEVCSQAIRSFDSYVEHQQKAIRKRIGGAYAE
jgi:hypothetical protein